MLAAGVEPDPVAALRRVHVRRACDARHPPRGAVAGPGWAGRADCQGRALRVPGVEAQKVIITLEPPTLEPLEPLEPYLWRCYYSFTTS